MTKPIVKGPNWRHGNYRNGKSKTSAGYILTEAFEHPHADSRGRIYEHILVAEKALGKILPLKAKVHHINEVADDNRNRNLVICENQAYHMLLHSRMRALAATGDVHALKCCYCKTWMLPTNPEFRAFKKVGKGWHYSCRAKYDKNRWNRIRGAA